MTTNLYMAHNQWSSRPDDERFWSVEEMHGACRDARQRARETTRQVGQLRCEPLDDTRLRLASDRGSAGFSHWGFGQLSRLAGAPAEYLRSLPAPLAADCVNDGLRRIPAETPAALLFDAGDDLTLRAVTSDKYSRIWNADITDRLCDLSLGGWVAPPAMPAKAESTRTRIATEADCGPHTLIRPGQRIAPAGLYASDHDMWAFLVDTSRRIDDGTDGGLSRGIVVSNSEVGGGAARLSSFLFRHICGNHIILDVSEFTEVRLVHRGDAALRWDRAGIAAAVRQYADSSPGIEEQAIRSAKEYQIADNRNETIDALFGKRIASRKALEDAYAAAVEQAVDFSPRSAWGFAQGLTLISQRRANADARLELDRAAGRVLAMAG